MDLFKVNFYNFIDQYVEIIGVFLNIVGNVCSVCYLVKDYILEIVIVDMWDINSIINIYVMVNGIVEDIQKLYISCFNGVVIKFIVYEKGEDVIVKQCRLFVKYVLFLVILNKFLVKIFDLLIFFWDDFIVIVGNLFCDLIKDEVKRISIIIELFVVFQLVND